MSFNINGPSNIPSIQETQSMKNNGGGGNLGYFMREENDEPIKLVEEQEEDTFVRSSDEVDEEKFLSLFDKFCRFLKSVWKIIVSFCLAKKEAQKNEFIKK